LLKKSTWQIKPIAAGTYTITISAEKFKEKVEPAVTVKQGQITTINTTLDPA
jgi:uncharacterized protein with FMN-binding domain